MATITFGLGQTYDWNDTYWGLTNVQDTNITTYAGTDGWKVLAFIATTNSKTWTNLTGWVETSAAGTDSSSDGNELTQYSTTADNNTYLRATGFGDSDNTWTLFNLVKISNWSISTDTSGAWRGQGMDYYDGTRRNYVFYRSDGTNIDLYTWNGATAAKVDTTQPIDTSRYHITGLYNNNSATNVVMWDGIEIAVGATNANAAIAGDVFLAAERVGGDPATITWDMRWTNYWNSITPWETTDGTLISVFDDAIYDAGAGNVWTQLDWTDDTSNSTAITYEVKCASSTGGLAGASYETITSSGDAIVTQDRYIQIKITMADASSGQYTPILKTLTATSGAAATPGRTIAGRKVRIVTDTEGTPTTALEIDAAQTASFSGSVNLAASTTSLASMNLPTGPAPTSPVDGDAWYDSTQKSITRFTDGIAKHLGGTIFVQTADATVANTTTETTVVSTGVGTVTLPANFFVAGKELELSVAGHYSTANPAGTLRVKVKYGTTVLLDTTANTMTNGLSNRVWNIKGVHLTCRTAGATGTIVAQGFVRFATSHTTAAIDDFTANTSAVVVDTTASQAISVTVEWGTANASNTITCTNLSVKALN